MADGRRRNVLVGLFMLGGLVALGILIVRFGEARILFGRGYVVEARFEKIVGVREGTEARLAGVPVGRVLTVDLVDRERPGEGVRVEMEVQQDVLIPRGSVAVVAMPIWGQPVINIMPPLPDVPFQPLPQDGTAMISGRVTNPLESVIDPMFIATLERTTYQIGNLAEALQPAARAVTDLLEQRTIQEVEAAEIEQRDLTANLYTAVERMHNVLRHLETVVGDPDVQSNLRLTLDNFRAASEDARLAVTNLNRFSEDMRAAAADTRTVILKVDATVDTTHARIDELGRALLENSNRLAQLLDHASVAARDLAEGDGTLGRLLRDPRFYDELLLTTQRFGTAASEMTVFIRQFQERGLIGMMR